MEIKQCTGCAACAFVCPTRAIEMQPDEKGFIYPILEEKDCIHCNRCVQVCPVNRQQREKDIEFGSKVYAAWSLNEELRLNSTSGGIFSELASWIFMQDGVVVGAAYDENFGVVYQAITEKSKLEVLRQSKYVEARENNEIKEVKEFLNQGKKVLFVGTPCKVAGVKAALGRNTENLFTCDFICRGSNAPIAYQKYLDSLEKQSKSKITKVWFKNKRDGWNQFGTNILFENGMEYFANRYEDLYMKGYLKHNLFLRDSCTNCSFKNDNRYADITLADFWGIKLPTDKVDIEKGISMVSINSDKGNRMWESICDHIGYEESDKTTAISKNWCAINSVQHGPYRDYFYQELEKKRDFSELMLDIEKQSQKQEG